MLCTGGWRGEDRRASQEYLIYLTLIGTAVPTVGEMLSPTSAPAASSLPSSYSLLVLSFAVLLRRTNVSSVRGMQDEVWQIETKNHIKYILTIISINIKDCITS